MRYTTLLIMTLLSSSLRAQEPGAAAAPAAPAPAPAALPEPTPQNVGTALGTLIGRNIKSQNFDLDVDQLVAALKDTLAGKPGKLTDDQCQQLLQKAQADAAASAGKKAAEAGKAFLAENAKKKGVTTTASGLQYEVMKEGTGAKPTAAETVKVHYHGTLTNGEVFDSSVQRGEPISFPLNGVIKGWTEGLQLMPTGSKFKFTIPSDLAYGDRGSPPKIGPGATLIFEVELLGIEAGK